MTLKATSNEKFRLIANFAHPWSIHGEGPYFGTRGGCYSRETVLTDLRTIIILLKTVKEHWCDFWTSFLGSNWRCSFSSIAIRNESWTSWFSEGCQIFFTLRKMLDHIKHLTGDNLAKFLSQLWPLLRVFLVVRSTVLWLVLVRSRVKLQKLMPKKRKRQKLAVQNAACK